MEESRTYLKNLAIAPKKLRLMLGVVKSMRPADAVTRLAYMHEKPARIYFKAINSAMANARQVLKTSDDMLEFKLLTIEEGHVLKRYNPGSKGTAKPYQKKLSHIKIVIVARTPAAPKKEEKKTEASTVKEAEPQVETKKIEVKAVRKTAKTLKQVQGSNK